MDIHIVKGEKIGYNRDIFK